MIAKLRRKFILIAMCSVVAVVFCIMAALNVANYMSVSENADEVLSYLSENSGQFPKTDNHKNTDIFRGFKSEAPYVTRYFTVVVNDSGEAETVNTGSIKTVTSKQAVDMAVAVWKSGAEKGYSGDFRYMTSSTDNGTMVIFLDNSRELSSFRMFLNISLFASLGGTAVVFVLVWFFSRRAIKPIAESYEKQKQFITDAGHEIKTPLTMIETNAEVIEMENGESKWTEGIKKQVQRLAELTDSLISLSRMDEEGSSVLMTEFSLSDAVCETADSFAARAKLSGRELSCKAEPMISYTGDERSIRRLVTIFLDNALKYSPEGGAVELELKRRGKGAVITCKNSVEGGIDRGPHQELFERFYRRDASRNSSGGYGIGLSMAESIVKLHKGKITARSDDGETIVMTAVI